MRKYFVLCCVCLGVFAYASLCFSYQSEDVIVTGGSTLGNTQTFEIDGFKIILSAKSPIDLSRVVRRLAASGKETMESVQQKIDKERKKLFPKDEIVLIIENTQPHAEAAGVNKVAGVELYKSYLHWNFSCRSGGYVYAWWKCHAMAAFISDVRMGGFYIYSYENGYWKYGTSVGTGGSVGSTAVRGGMSGRGRKFVGSSAINQADIIMYFFKIY